MYLFYIDESGNRDASLKGIAKDGASYEKDPLFVYVAVSLMEHSWKRFQRNINYAKSELLRDVNRVTGQRLTLSDARVRSSIIRRPSERERHPFFQYLTKEQTISLSEVFYKQLPENKMRCFAVVIDKRKLKDFFDTEKMCKKAYELLLERIQNCLREYHSKHLGMIVADDAGREMNEALSLKHCYFQESGTSAGVKLSNIVETPFFVPDELSNGVQLADLCAYNVYRAFKYKDAEYKYFKEMLPWFYRSETTPAESIDGLKVFPDDSELVEFAREIGKKTARPPV
jgi:hypothetical protein